MEKFKEFLDQPKKDYDIPKESKDIVFGKEKDKNPMTREEVKALYQKIFKEININNYSPNRLKSNLKSAIKIWESEIEDLKKEGTHELTLLSIEDRKKKILKNSLWVTKLDDFMKNREITIDGSTFNEN